MQKVKILGAATAMATLFFVAGTASAAPTCGLNNGEKATGEPIKIGAIVGETGLDDFSSAADSAGAYFDCVNANGGINGRPIEYIMHEPATREGVCGGIVMII